jgi:uncharacterized protein YjbI with pentapeptide repeats
MTQPARDSLPSTPPPSGDSLTPDLEARFIEQEHRIVRVVQNYFDRTQWPAGDPRRRAARNAVVWRILAPGTAAVAASSLIAVATLIVLVWQTSLIAEQNAFFKDQNQKLQLQIDQQADQDVNRRRTEIIASLYETQMGTEGILVPRANPRTRGEAVFEFVQLERQRLKRLRERVPAYQAELSLTAARLDRLNLDNMDLSGLILVGTFLQNTSFARADLTAADFRAAMLESTAFRDAVLKGSNFEGTNPLEVSFARADLRDANFISAGIRGCEFLGADLRGASLHGLRDWKDSTNFRFANIAGVKGLSEELREHMISQGAVEIANDQEWTSFRTSRFASE